MILRDPSGKKATALRVIKATQCDEPFCKSLYPFYCIFAGASHRQRALVQAG